MEESGIKEEKGGGNVEKEYEVTKIEKIVKSRYCIRLHPLKPEKIEVMPTAETEEEKIIMRMAKAMQYFARFSTTPVPVSTPEVKYPVYSDEDIEIYTNVEPSLKVGSVVKLSLEMR